MKRKRSRDLRSLPAAEYNAVNLTGGSELESTGKCSEAQNKAGGG